MVDFGSRLKHAWNAFANQDDTRITNMFGAATPIRPDRPRLRITNERSIISSIYTRLSLDVAAIDIRHVRLDERDRYKDDVDSELNNCLTVEANLDQAARAFRQDIAMTLLTRVSQQSFLWTLHSTRT